MSLAPGTRLGPYEIIAPIGAGGMGEVYRVRDTKLKREVALKVLPDAFAQDAERMARFEREACVLAALNHPNIAHIYSVEERALVMELVEGQTLSSPLPLETALNDARQIAQALEYAHEKGVIHRDLKPTNIKVTPEGVVKLLDFGLAKAIEDPAGPADDPSVSPTLTLGATRVGVIMGTAAYMSPEQASGKTADRRADIWSFGAVLYEMLAGKKAFEGESVSDTLASVLKLDPDWDALPAATPVSIRRLVRRCLTKDRKQRLQAIGEARIILESPTAEEPAPVTAPSQSRLGWVAAALAVALGIATVAWWRATRPVDRPLIRLDVDLGPDVSLPPPGAGSSVIISPDGTRLVYLASVSGGSPRLFTRRLDQREATELRGTAEARAPFFSPDGQWVGFSIGSRLNKISVEGGAVVPLSGDVNAPAASWGEDEGIIIGHFGKGLVRIPSGGGTPKPITEVENGEQIHAYPESLAGGKSVLFVAYRGPGPDAAEIKAASLTDRSIKTLVHGGVSPHYLPGGYLVYVNKGVLFAIRFDLDTLETRGTAVPVLDDVECSASGSGEFDVSRNGTLVYRRGSGGGVGIGMTTIEWLYGSGNREPLLAKPGVYRNQRISPDGKKLALVFIGEDASQDVWIYDTRRDAMTRLTAGGGVYSNPVWSPDGRYVVFGVDMLSGSIDSGMFWARADGASHPQRLIEGKLRLHPFSFTPDGKQLAYIDTSSGVTQLWTLPLEDQSGGLKPGKPEEFLKTQLGENRPMFSPDGRWLAYQQFVAPGKAEIYIRPFPRPPSGQGGQWQISNNGGTAPVWSRTRRELLYKSGNQIMAVSYTVKGDSFVADKPRVWAPRAWASGVAGNIALQDFDLAPDGKRVAVLAPPETTETPKAEHDVVFLLNFLDELRRRAPAGK